MHWVEPLMPWQIGPGYPRWNEALRDGSEVLVRPVRMEDANAERVFIQSLSPEASRYRFLGQVRQPSDALIATLTDLDYVHDIAFAAVIDNDGVDTFVGVSRYSTSRDGTDCECAVTVLDVWQHKGLATLLMTHLIEVARSRGIKRMWSIDAADNTAMADLARHMAFDRTPDPDNASQVIHSLQL